MQFDKREVVYLLFDGPFATGLSGRYHCASRRLE
jgi:hypothetical protein